VKQRFPTLEHVVEAGTSILSSLHVQHFHEHTRDKRFFMKIYENLILGAFHDREKCFDMWSSVLPNVCIILYSIRVFCLCALNLQTHISEYMYVRRHGGNVQCTGNV
jgi:hypothetical protein